MNPVDFFASLGMAEQIGTVLSWVAFAISAAVGLTFALLGLRKGLSFFFELVNERKDGGRGAVFSELDGFMEDWQDSGWSIQQREFGDYMELRAAGHSHDGALHIAFGDPDDPDTWRAR